MQPVDPESGLALVTAQFFVNGTREGSPVDVTHSLSVSTTRDPASALPDGPSDLQDH